MKTIASFTFKFKVIENSKTKKSCRIVVQFEEIKNHGYQIVTYMYQGNDIINIERSTVSCYLHCKETFFRNIERMHIDRLIANNY